MRIPKLSARDEREGMVETRVAVDFFPPAWSMFSVFPWGYKNRTPKWSLLSIVTCIFLLFHIPPSRSQEGHGQDLAVLMVIFDIPSAQVKSELAAAIESQTSDLLLRVIFMEDAEEVGGVASFSMEVAASLAALHEVNFVCFIRQNEAGRLVVHVFEESKRAMLSREVQSADLSTTAQVEVASIMVRGYLKLLAEGGEIGIVPPAAPREEKREEPVRTKAAPAGAAGIFVSYAMNTFSSEQALVHGAAVGIDISPAVFRNFSIGVRYTMLARVSASDESLYFEAYAHPVNLGLKYRIRIGRFEILPGLEVVLEYVKRNAVAYSEKLMVLADSGGLNVAMAPSLRLSFRAMGNAGLFAQAGMNIYLNRVYYVYETAGTQNEITTPWPVGFDFLCGVFLYLI
jgi:hypothetical protein